MGTTLTGTTPQDTYDSLIKVTDNGPLGATAKLLTDGLGNDSVLALSTSAVGVGATTLFTKMSIANSLSATSIGTNYNAGILNIQNTNTTNGNLSLIGFQDASASINLAALGAINTTHSGSPNSVVGELGFYTKAAGGGYVAERMRITSAGNVGIGTSSPATRLHVAGADAWLTLQRTSGTTNIIDFTDSTATRIGYVGAIASNITINAAAGNSIIFAPNNAEVGRFTANGLTFNGDTAAANALDDYEEGTFTPTAYGATSAGTTTYNNQNGYYTKIGRMVNVSFFVSYSALTGTGSLLLGGLPFAISNSTQNYPIGSLVADGLNWTGGTYLQAIGLQGETNIAINYIADDASVANQQCVNEAASLRINLTYFV